MKLFLGLVIGLVAGFGLAWYLSPGPYRYFYKAASEIEILGTDAKLICTLPAGTPMLSEVKLRLEPDLGWWAYVPVQFDGMKVAQDMGIEPGDKKALIDRATLHAHTDYDKLYPGPVSIQVYEGKIIEPGPQSGKPPAQ